MGGGYLEPVGTSWSLGASGGGAIKETLEGGFKSVFGNQQVADGIRTAVEAARGGIPIGAPPVDPGYLPDPAGGMPLSRFRGDWDANAWRPAHGGFRGQGPIIDPYDGPLGSQPGGPGYGDPALGGATLRDGLSQIGRGMLNGARSGAIFSGAISLVLNGLKVFKREVHYSEAAGSVMADTASGAVSGALGAAVSGAALFAATAAGLTIGLPLTLIGIAGGLGGALLGSWIFKKTGLYDGIKSGITRLLGGSSLSRSIGREIPVRGGTPYGNPYGNPYGTPYGSPDRKSVV